MTFYNASGTRLTEDTFTDVTDPVTAVDIVEFTQDVYQSITLDGGGFEKASRMAFVDGQRVPQSEIDGLFVTATIDTITPVTGPAAGGTPVVVKGTNFSGAAGATLGGVALTAFKVVNNTTITGTSGAHAAGAVTLVVQDDADDVSKVTAFTYV